MTREEHKARIDKQQKSFDIAKKTMDKMFGIRDRFEEGSVFFKGMQNLDSELKFNIIKTDLEVYLQEAIDDGYPELAI